MKSKITFKAIILLLGANLSALHAQTLPTSFSWTSTGPVISPKSDATHNMIAVKDPSIVRYNGQYVVYASSVNSAGNYGMEYLHFTDWSTAGAATPYFMDNTSGFSGYHTAPQVFYFAPQNKWYLIFQSGQPQYSTNSDPTQPQNWTTPKNFFASQPSSVSAWIDFWIISDSSNVYLFFCGDNGNFYRSSTSLTNFPNGFNTPVIVYSESNSFNLFEADNVYTIENTGTYLANIECIGSDGHRFFRALQATSLGGTWTPLGNTANLNTPFLGSHNVTFQSGVSNWTLDFSSGGAVIDGDDSTDSINLNNLTFLYQGDNPNNGASSYNLIPWQLGLASSKANTALPTATSTSAPPTRTATPTNTAAATATPTPCAPTAITPFMQANGGAWTQESTMTVASLPATVNLGPQPLTGGSWSWTGPNGFTSTSREIDNIPLGVGANIFTATYTNTCGLKSTQTFTVTVQTPPTATNTRMVTPENTSTATAVPPTRTITPTDLMTATPSLTATPSASPTKTAVPPTATHTPAPPTDTPTFTLTPLPPTATHTPLPPTVTFTSAPPTWTMTPTDSMTATPSLTATPSASPTKTAIATATNTPVPPTDTPTAVVSSGSFKVQLLSATTGANTNSPHPQLQIVNTGSGPLNLDNVTVRYWFNCDCTTQGLQAWVDWAGLIPQGTSETGNVHVSVQPTSLGGQTDYVLYSFTGNITLQPGQALQIQSRFNKSDWSNMNQSNDWSFAPYTSFTNAPDVTGYLGGNLVWGQQPAAASAALSASSALVFPNPSTGNGTTLSFTLNGGSTGAGASALDAGRSFITDPNAKITLAIYTLSMRFIWGETLSGGAYGTTGQHDLYWNEKDLKGVGLANGVYLLKVTVESNGQTSSTFAKILILG